MLLFAAGRLRETLSWFKFIKTLTEKGI
ncbi:hypothetical protein PT2222_130236 [Paraburkholderia tropica]